MKQNKGFTLIELIIVIALTAGLLGVGVALIANIYETVNKARAETEVRQNLQYVFDTMAREIRKAKYIKVETSGTNNILSLYNDSSCQNDTSSVVFTINTGTPSTLNITKNSIITTITSNKVDILSLKLTDFSPSVTLGSCQTTNSFLITITAKYNTSVNRPDFTTQNVIMSERVALRKY